MVVGRITTTRPGIIFTAINQHGAHAGIACSIEFLDGIGQEQDVFGSVIQPVGDQAVAVGVALVADLGVEESGEQRGEVAGVGIAEEQLLRRNGAGRVHSQCVPSIVPAL